MPVTGLRIIEAAECKGVCNRLTDEQIQLVLEAVRLFGFARDELYKMPQA